MAYQIPGQGSVLYETWVMLLNGYGYNWYRLDNQLREDDLLVRERACYFLTEAASKMQKQEADYHRKYLPEPSREQPFPPAARMATHRLMRETRQGILALECRVRGQSVPPTDKVWQRYRTEIGSMDVLVHMDVQLVGLCQAVDEEAARFRPETWDNEDELNTLRSNLGMIEQLLTQRAQYLLVPTGKIPGMY